MKRMKMLILLAISALTVITANAQQNNVYITSGTLLAVKGNLLVTLNNMGLVNNGIFTPDTGNVIFTGDSVAYVSGANISFYNLTVDNNTTVTLNNDITIQNQINLNGLLNVKNNTLNLGANATILNEDNNYRIIGDSASTGNATTTRDFTLPIANVNPGNLGVEIISAPALGNTTITRFCAAVVNNNSSAGLITRYYKIDPTNNNALNAAVRFHYLDTELNGITENNAVLWKSNNNGLSWQQIIPDAINTTNNWVQKNNINDFSIWTIGNSNSALPIILNSFNTNCDEKGAHLLWTTSFEQNSYIFVIEKSLNGLEWTTIGTIDAKGRPSYYNFTDHQAGKVFYRLKQIDNDGAYTYSKILESNCSAQSITLMLYPNPTVDFITLDINSNDTFNTLFQLINLNGQVIATINANLNKGANKIRINTDTFPAGTYFLVSNNEQLPLHKKFIKQ